ncbi:Chromo domain/shadow [Macrophomina phaseolina MS6]|uniref:Chromo domain/shadow n=1 Tax=Macrophomina phaseolina (strain MS6) TaxID=1126212 RepID=K2QVV7_MACPH|nr:Chromo domain/shadow [Macrophomina phaseolina MS6]
MLPPITQNGSALYYQKCEPEESIRPMSSITGSCLEETTSTDSETSRETPVAWLRPCSPEYQGTPQASAHVEADTSTPATGAHEPYLRQPFSPRRRARQFRRSEPYTSPCHGREDKGNGTRLAADLVTQDLSPPAVLEKNEYYVDCLLQRRARRHQGGKRKVISYLVKWKGYGPEHNSWVLKRNIDTELVRMFDLHQS